MAKVHVIIIIIRMNTWIDSKKKLSNYKKKLKLRNAEQKNIRKLTMKAKDRLNR